MDKRKIKRVVLHIVFILLLFALQAAVFSRLRIFGASPLLLPIAAVGFGLYEGGLRGGLWGLVSGVLCDVAMGDSGVLFTVFCTLAGFFAGFLSEFVLARGFPSFAMLSGVTLVLSALLQSFALLFFKNVPPLPVLRIALVQTLYSLLFILPLYYPVRKLRGRSF